MSVDDFFYVVGLFWLGAMAVYGVKKVLDYVFPKGEN